MEYPIEIIDLFKRYPVSVKKLHQNRSSRNVSWRTPPGDHSGILNYFRSINGPYIEALRGVNLKVKEGEVIGLLGPNGAGKTTLIKILSTMVIHDEGEVYVHGIDVKMEPSQVLKKLQAILPESRGFNWRLSGRQNLEFYACLYGLRKREARERINNLLEFTGMMGRADDGYQQYSTGMQRKLILCRALLQDTPTLLFDEPTTGLDPITSTEFRTLLVEKLAGEEKKTILLSTHNLAEAEATCDRIAILDQGKVIAFDTPENVRYYLGNANIFTVRFNSTTLNEKFKKIMKELEKIEGVIAVSPQVTTDKNLVEIILRVDKNINIGTLLDPINKSGLTILAINTKEPTLEEAFISMTGQYPEQPRQIRRFPRRP